MKVIFVIDSLRGHGTQRFLLHLVGGLAQREYDIAVIALNCAADPEVTAALTRCGCEVTCIGKFALLFGFGWCRLFRLLVREKADVVVTMLDMADSFGRPLARAAGCPVVLSSIRARNLAKPKWRRWLDRRTIPLADRVVVNSREIVGYVREKEGVTERQLVVIPNGVEDIRTRAYRLREKYRAQLSVSAETTVLGCVGRLNLQKNQELLLEAASQLTWQTQPWCVVVVGDGPERRRLERLAKSLPLSDRVVWLGARDDVEGWLAAMDIFVHTADFEGMSNAVMEALAAGLPAVVTAVDGNLELVRDGETGFLVPPGDAKMFATRIASLMDDPARARAMGEAARIDVLQRFGIARMVDAYDQLFAGLVKERAAQT